MTTGTTSTSLGAHHPIPSNEIAGSGVRHSVVHCLEAGARCTGLKSAVIISSSGAVPGANMRDTDIAVS